LLITRGEDGMSLFRRGSPTLHIPAVERDVYDVTGAGDTVVGTLGLGLAAGLSIEDATRLANHAAGRVIRELGTATTSCAEIRQSLLRGDGPGEAPARGGGAS
jgi:D-beta-D-heptose 7-phosphate kinase/D-beta-D-heptose 1-phosphate adenosyltransferase